MRDDYRQHPRFPSSLETIYFTESDSRKNKDRMYYPGTVIDQSACGIGLRVSFQHKLNDLIWLEGMDGAEASDQPHPARVRWISNAESHNGEYRMGIEFTHAEDVLI